MGKSKLQLKRFIESLSEGDVVYINAISLSIKAIDLLREYVKSGKLTPVRNDVEKMIKAESVPAVMNGTIICPHMHYWVKEV